MKEDFDDIDFVSKRTKRGILLLVLLCLLIIYTPRVLSFFKNHDEIELTKEEMAKVEELQANFQTKEKQRQKNSYKKREYRRPPAKFDPNQYAKEEWMYVGLSEKQADVMLKISAKGIWSNEFLSKIVVIPDEVYVLIKDSVYFPSKEYPKKEYDKKEGENIKNIPPRSRPNVNVNTATEEEMISVPGIGPYFAKRILAYRDLLGGYAYKEQMLEVYNLDYEKFEKFDSFIIVDASEVRKFNINRATRDELKAHPYFSFSVANSIVKMREQRGGYKKIEELKESELINAELFEKLKPYVYL